MFSKLTNVANFDALLGEIRAFVNGAGGWTIHQDLITPDEGTAAGGRQLVVSKGDVLAGMRSTTTGNGANRFYLFDGIPPWSSSNLDSMPGNSGIRYSDAVITSTTQPAARHLQQFAGPFPTVHLFTDNPSTYVHVVVEITSGVYKHLLFGPLQKYGVWVGGGYYACTSWSTNVNFIDSPSSTTHHVPFDNVGLGEENWTVHYVNGSDNWITPTENVLNGVQRRMGRGSFRGGFGQSFANIPETSFSGFVGLAPVHVQAVRQSDTPDTTRLVGKVPDFRAVNIQNLFPGNSYFIGADEWVVFPLVAKNGAVDQFNSGTAGCAYLKRS